VRKQTRRTPRKKETKKDTKEKKGKDEKDGSTAEYIDLGGSKRVSVSTFKGQKLVDIRAYWTDSPTKKGISLTKEQWEKLKGAVDKIDELYQK